MAPTLQPPFTLRLLHLVANLGVFAILYPLANVAAQNKGIRDHVMLDWDSALPFLPWMIVPYMTSGVLFAASFLLARSRVELRALSCRVLCATVVACAVFVAWPLRFHLDRPEVGPALAGALFDTLGAFDLPYNQLPSLHVAYCVLFWQPLRAACASRTARAAVSLWITLVAASTLFTYQHHLLDVAAGLALGLAVLVLVKPSTRATPPVAFYYLVGAFVCLLAAITLRSVLLVYPAASLALIALAYARNRPDFLGKAGGRYRLASYLLYAPYLLGYWLTWQCVRLRGAPPFVQMAPGLLVGRRLAAREAAALPTGCMVIDLANELSETPSLRDGHYRHFHLFDLAPIPPAMVDAIVAEMARAHGAGRAVYLHCAMGYSRSIFLATAYLQRHPCASPVPVDHALLDLPAQAALPATPASPDE